jgi:hypothetical protein
MLLFPSFSPPAQAQQQDTSWASSICSRERNPIKKNSVGWTIEDDLSFYIDWREVKDKKMSIQQLKNCLDQMEYERATASATDQALIDWWRPIYEDHLILTLEKQEYDAKMAVWNSPEAVAERAKVTTEWIERRFKSPEMACYRQGINLR